MEISNRPPERLDKKTLLNVAIVLGSIKGAMGDNASAKGLLSIAVELKAQHIHFHVPY